ncbi:hypothetical protein [Vagococcus silagei]|uniref:Uncharacterized protein n=1 Tax=Vagococcus silagei TaxID=2508885 RepID=A0A4S3B0T3_9ENTE|nr:hypothetical protein [Vagococcus silagei]THB60621.1 hypothetical protein ESZ54_09415 [Vagococcus silagei]
MIQTINKTLTQFGEKLNINVQLPTPSKKQLKQTKKINTLISATCMTTGLILNSNILVGLSIISGTSIIVVHLEEKHNMSM